MNCKHCKKEDCYEHCQKAADGIHRADPTSFKAADGAAFLVDVWCLNCKQSGAVAVRAEDIQWG